MAKIFFAAILLALALAPQANAGQSGDYVGMSSGVLMTNRSTVTDQQGSTATLRYDTIGIPVSVYLGHQFGIGLRVEEEGFYKRSSANQFAFAGTKTTVDSPVWCIGAMTNVYYDWFHDLKGMENDSYSPYIGVGVGLADVHLSEVVVNRFKLWNSGSALAFGYQAILGNSTPIAKDISLDISYRYFATNNFSVDKVKTGYDNHNVLVGVRYTFR